MSSSMRALLWTGIVLLIALAVLSSTVRVVILLDPQNETVERFHQQAVRFVYPDTFPLWLHEMDRINARFAASAVVTFLHVVCGAIFLVLAPLQFSARIRDRHRAFHRWSGRVLAAAAIVTGVTALHLGVVVPHTGVGEVTSTAFFGGVFLTAIVCAVLAIRRGDVVRHREWMIRAFAIAAGVSTVRIVAIVIGQQLAAPVDELFGLSFWTGWAISLGVAELWIRVWSSPSGLPLEAGSKACSTPQLS